MRLVPADSLDLGALTEVFNEAYSDYVVPLRLDRSALEFTLAVCDVDLAASRVALEEQTPVAFAFLAVRGGEGWIGGMGTVPTQRRRGLGEAALSAVLGEARIRGAQAVRLEVIDGNEAARRLYEKLGFERVRALGVWALDSAPPRTTKAEPADVERAHAWIRSNRRAPEPWQRADETVEHMRARGAALEALVVGPGAETTGALLYQPGPPLPRIVQLAAHDERSAAHLLAAVAARGDGLRFVNVPEGDPAETALTGLRARVEARQQEMRITL